MSNRVNILICLILQVLSYSFGFAQNILPTDAVDSKIIAHQSAASNSIEKVLEQLSKEVGLKEDGKLEIEELSISILDNGPFSDSVEVAMEMYTVEEYREDAEEALSAAASALANGAATPENIGAAAKKLAQATALKNRANKLENIYNNSDTLNIRAVDFYENLSQFNGNTMGLDISKYEAHRLHYNIMVLPDGNIKVPWVATKAGEAGSVKAKFLPNDSVKIEDISFKSGADGSTLTAQLSSNEWTITLPAISNKQPLVVNAVDQNGATVGKLNAIGYEEIKRKVHIIPVGTSNADFTGAELTNYLNRIYAQAGATWEVEMESAISVEGYDGTLQDDEQQMLSTYSDGMKAIIKAYKNKENVSIVDNEFYLFLVDKSGTGKSGYMPRKHQYGFIYMGESGDKQRTVAHELGHGAFRLQHPWEEYPTIAEGSTDNLMDYGTGTNLRKYQWDLIHNPPVVVGLVEDLEEGSYTDKTYIQKVMQQLRCASFDNIATLKLAEKTGTFYSSFEAVSSVKLTISDKDIVLNRIANPEEKQVGGQNRNTAWLGKYGDGLIIQVESKNVSDFHAIQDYIFPDEGESSLGDARDFLASIKDKEEIEESDIEKLRNIANCGSENFTVAYRFQLIKEIESLNPVSLTPIYEDLILDLIENHREDIALDVYANEWLDLLALDRPFLKKLFYGIDEYQWWSGSEANQTRFMQAIQALWQISKYNSKQNSAYTYDQYSFTSSGDIEVKSPYTLVYGGTKLFPRVEYDAVVTSNNVRFNSEVYTQQGTKFGHFDYHPFQPIHLIKEDQSGVSYLQFDMPAIALVPLMEADNFDRGIERAGLTADIVLTITGVGNLTKLRHLSKLQKAGRILLAGIEISSSTLDIVLDYTDICSDEEFCPKLKQYNFYLQMALLGGEGMSTLYKGLMESSRKSAKEAYQESRSALIAKHGEESDQIRALDEHFEITVLVGKYDWNLVRRYFQYIQEVTNRSVHPKQIEKLKEALRVKDYRRLSQEATESHRIEFNKKRINLISQWETNTGQNWPRYQVDIYEDGKKVATKGHRYDAHHIIENKYGGDNEWWNIHPAARPQEHQRLIHGADSPALELFN